MKGEVLLSYKVIGVWTFMSLNCQKEQITKKKKKTWGCDTTLIGGSDIFPRLRQLLQQLVWRGIGPVLVLVAVKYGF